MKCILAPRYFKIRAAQGIFQKLVGSIWIEKMICGLKVNTKINLTLFNFFFHKLLEDSSICHWIPWFLLAPPNPFQDTLKMGGLTG